MTTSATSLVRSSSASLITEVLSSGSIYTLPAVIPIGTIYEVINTQTAVDVDIKSSNGTTLETICNGICKLIALQTNPTTSAHWRVLHVYEKITHNTVFTFGGGAATGGANAYITRHNKNVTLTGFTSGLVTSATATSTANSNTDLLARFCPWDSLGVPVSVIDNGSAQASAGWFVVGSSGNMAIYKTCASGGFSGGVSGATGLNIGVSLSWVTA